MAVKGMSEQDAIEYSTLQDSVSRLQNLLFMGGLEGDALVLMRRFVENAKSRMGQLEIGAEEHRRKAEEEEQATALMHDVMLNQLVERETTLSSEEKQEYRGLLGHEFFTKSMFGTIEHFYARSWDKLTEGGKAQVSHRVWEGIRHGEYRFEELPEVVKEKEAERLHDIMESPSKMTATEKKPLRDVKDFCEAYDRGNKREACRILGRPSFAEWVGRDESIEVKSASPVRNVMAAERSRPKVSEEEKASSKDKSLGDLDMDNGAIEKLRAAQSEIALDPAAPGRKAPDAGIKTR